LPAASVEAGLPGAAVSDVEGGTTPGGAPVKGGGVVPGGGFSGPLMPQAAIDIAIAHAMKAAGERRSIAPLCRCEFGKV